MSGIRAPIIEPTYTRTGVRHIFERIPLAFVLLLLAIPAYAATGHDYPKLAPYSAIRWIDESPEVRVDGTWYALRAIDGISVNRIVRFAMEEYGGRWQKRFEEDLVQVLGELGHATGETVRLALGNPKTGLPHIIEHAPMTNANRQAIWRENSGRQPGEPLAYELTSKHLHRALDDFAMAIDRRWAYRHANDADFDAAIAVLRSRIDNGIDTNDFGVELQKIIALGIDGHARVDGYELPSRGYLPFLIEPEGDRFVAFKPGRVSLVDEGFPYVTEIDGKSISEWCKEAAKLVPCGSAQYSVRQCLRHLRHLDYFRERLNLPLSGSLKIALTTPEGDRSKTDTLPLANQLPRYGSWPRAESRILAGNVGYLRILTMDPGASVQEVKRSMERFRNTTGLIIDVRDNGGGARDALLLMYGYLSAKDAAPRVVSAAKYRLHRDHDSDHLAARYMHRADAEVWAKDERWAIAHFARTFDPEWQPPESEFSDWHYLVLNHREDPEIYHYGNPVVVLMNAKCFSATDIFLAGLKGLPNVTLLGLPSGGGSARSQRVRLGDTPFSLRIGSMASFQADGKLFDGNGVEPDVIVRPSPEYYIGGADDMLTEALERVGIR